MKKALIAIVITRVAICSCKLEYGSTTGRTFGNMKEYTETMFSNNIIYPAGVINMLVSLDQYVSASEEERESETFQWHRANIFHEDDVTYMIKSLGTVYTHGKSFNDPDSNWELDNGMIITRTGDNTWKVGRSDEHRYPYNCTVTYAGKSDDDKNVFTVEAYNTDESTISQYSETVVKAIMTTQEGSMTIIDPQPKHYEYYWDDEGFPEGSGLFRIDTEMHGKPLDWAELRYDPSGKKLEFNSNL